MKISDKTGQTVNIYPWDMHVISYTKILKLVDKKRVNKNDVIKLLSDIEEIQDIYDEHNAKMKKRNNPSKISLK